MDKFIRALERLCQETENIFQQIRKNYRQEVKCKKGCVDCCYALFDLSLAEALFLYKNLLLKPRKIRRKIQRNLEKYEKEWEKKAPKDLNPFSLSKIKIRCPLLGDDNLCLLYESRPLTCRIYGIPVVLKGKTFVCGFSGFEIGKKYPSIYWDKVQKHLYNLSDMINPGQGAIRISLSQTLRGNFPKAHLLAK